MKFMLMMNGGADSYDEYLGWPKDVRDANVAFMQALGARLRASGEFVSAAGLTAPAQAQRVRMGAHGKPFTDGVFPESKEFLAGYWIVDVDTPERAYAIAAEASAAPGQGGRPLNMAIEVRQVMSGPPTDWTPGA
jgi:hypothetical protein